MKMTGSTYDIQKWIDDFYKAKGWSIHSNGQYGAFVDLSYLMQEAGEVATEITRIEVGREGHNEEISKEEMIVALTEELGDVLAVVSVLCTRYGITLDQAFEAHKEKMIERFQYK